MGRGKKNILTEQEQEQMEQLRSCLNPGCDYKKEKDEIVARGSQNNRTRLDELEKLQKDLDAGKGRHLQARTLLAYRIKWLRFAIYRKL